MNRTLEFISIGLLLGTSLAGCSGGAKVTETEKGRGKAAADVEAVERALRPLTARPALRVFARGTRADRAAAYHGSVLPV